MISREKTLLNIENCQLELCPIQFILNIIARKWTILILQELFLGKRRTYEFLSALSGISTKTLTSRLRELEAHGLVQRSVYAEIPPRVEYSLTQKGLEIQPVMESLSQVGQQWLQQEKCCCPLIGSRKM